MKKNVVKFGNVTSRTFTYCYKINTFIQFIDWWSLFENPWKFLIKKTHCKKCSVNWNLKTITWNFLVKLAQLLKTRDCKLFFCELIENYFFGCSWEAKKCTSESTEDPKKNDQNDISFFMWSWPNWAVFCSSYFPQSSFTFLSFSFSFSYIKPGLCVCVGWLVG